MKYEELMWTMVQFVNSLKDNHGNLGRFPWIILMMSSMQSPVYWAYLCLYIRAVFTDVIAPRW